MSERERESKRGTHPERGEEERQIRATNNVDVNLNLIYNESPENRTLMHFYRLLIGKEKKP